MAVGDVNCFLSSDLKKRVKRAYETDENFSMLVFSPPALAFVPEEEVVKHFEELVVTFPD